MNLSEVKFTDLNLPTEVITALNELNFSNLTEVQAKSIPLAFEGKDVAVQAQTGTGKTAAFLVTIFNHILKHPKPKTKGVCPRAIVLTPTRELAIQVAEDAKKIGKYLELKILVAYGGVDYGKQRDDIKEGVDLLIGTPGRLIDYLKQNVYHLKDVEIAVIDEADRMFDMGFIGDIRYLLKRMSPYDKRQSMLYSATLSDRVMELSYEYMNLPELIEVSPDTMVADKVEQSLYHLGSHEKTAFLFGILKNEEWTKMIIFVNTKRVGTLLSDTLNLNGYKTGLLSGDVDQKKRLSILKHFMSGETPIIVATDVASRGLHVEGISHVVNYDLPNDPQDYVHRIGRTARAGMSGKAVSLACEDYVEILPEVEAYIGHKVPVESPKEEYFVEYQKPPHKPREKRPFGHHGGGGRGKSSPSGGRGNRSPQRSRSSGRGK